MRLRSAALAFVPCTFLSLAACGDDAPSRAATATAGDAFCTAAVALDTKSGEFDAKDPFSLTPEELEAGINSLIADNERIAAIAPVDIQATVERSVAQQKVLAARLDALGWVFSAAFSDEEFMAAAQSQQTTSDELDAYTLEKCGVDLNAEDESSDSEVDNTLPTGFVTRDNFLDLYAMGAGVEITDEMKECFSTQIADVSDADLEAAMSGAGDQAVMAQVGAAVLACGIPVNQG